MQKYDYILIQTAYAGDDSPAYCRDNTPDNTLLFTFHYTPPYERLGQLKELQLEERSVNPFGRDFFYAVDLTEWLGHENEEYFEIICKYLADMKYRRKYIFMAASREKPAVYRLHIKLRTYMIGSCRLDERWDSKDSIIGVITEMFDYEPECARFFADILMKPEFDCHLSLSFIRMCTDEILNGKKEKITLDAFKKYMKNPDSLISLLSDGELNIAKEDEYVIK